MSEIVINAVYDDEARVWVAVNDDLGLATEAESIEVLVYKLKEMIPELVALNGLPLPKPIQFSVVSHRQVCAFA